MLFVPDIVILKLASAPEDINTILLVNNDFLKRPENIRKSCSIFKPWIKIPLAPFPSVNVCYPTSAVGLIVSGSS